MSSFISQITHRKKTPDKLVRLCAKCLGDLCNNAIAPTPFLDSKQLTDTQDELCKRLSQMKAILYGSEEKVEVDEEKALELCASIQQDGLMLALIANLNILPFEGRKDASQIFNNLIHKNINNFVSYMRDNIASVFTLIDSYALPDVALCCGSMLRECIRHDDLARLILASNNFWKLFDSYVDLPNFEVASDAFNTLKDLLTTTRNKSISADFLEQNYEKVFPKYEILLSSENYVTRRRSLKLLGELLLDRSNFSVMMRFISERRNLQLIMNLLRDKSPNIQFEAFHVFKVFVANPKKTPDVIAILYKNKEKIIAYLTNFHLDREDAQFVDEKRLLIETLSNLQCPITLSPVKPARDVHIGDLPNVSMINSSTENALFTDLESKATSKLSAESLNTLPEDADPVVEKVHVETLHLSSFTHDV